MVCVSSRLVLSYLCNMARDIATTDDVAVLVHSFYASVRADDLIGPIFNQRIGERWPEHLDKLVGFWSTVLLEVQAYSGAPFAPHANLPIDASHFERWLQLFKQTLDQHFSGPKANEAFERASKMGQMFQYKLDYLRNQGGVL